VGVFKQGDIVITKILFSNLTEFKLRPTLILVKRLKFDDFIVLKISTKKKGYSFPISKEDIEEGEIKKDPSYVIIDHPITIQRKNIKFKVAELKKDTMEQIKEKVRSLYQ